MAIEKVKVELSADASSVVSEVDKAKKKIGELAGASSVVSDAWGKVGGVIAGAVSVGAVVGFISRVNGLGDSLNDLSGRLEASASGLQAIEIATQLAGGSAEAADTALAKMSQTIGSAISGNKQAASAIERLGLSAQELAGMKADEAYRRIADAIAAIPNTYERAAAAQDIFGKGAKEITGALAQGSAAIDAVNRSLEEQGARLTDLDVAKIGVMNDQWQFQKTVVENLGIKFTAGLAPAVNVATGAISMMLGRLGGASEAGNTFGVILTAAIKAAEAAAYGLGAAFETVRAVISGMLAIIADGVSSLIGGIAGIGETLGFDWAKSVRRASDTMDSVAGALQNVSDQARENAVAAASYAIEAATQIVKAGEIFAAARADYEKQASAAAQATGGAPPGAPTGPTGTPAGDQIGLTSQQIGSVAGSLQRGADQVTDPTTDYRVIHDQLVNDLLLAQQQAYNDSSLGLVDQLQNSTIGALLTSHQFQIAAEEAKNATLGASLGNLAQMAMQQHGVLGKIGKAFAIAQTIWSTATGIMNAIAQVPYPANIAAAAAVAAMGVAQLANIKKTNLGSTSGTVAPVKGGSSGGAGASASMPENVPGTAAQDTKQNVAQIVINGNVFSSQETARWIIDQIRDAVSTQDVVFINANSRQAMELTGS